MNKHSQNLEEQIKALRISNEKKDEVIERKNQTIDIIQEDNYFWFKTSCTLVGCFIALLGLIIYLLFR